MRIRLLAVGRMKAGPERELADRYLERSGALMRPHGCSLRPVMDLPEGRARSPEERRRDEAGRLGAEVAASPFFAFDERGAQPTSEAFAARLTELRDGGLRDLVLVIGGPDGLAAAFRQEAAWTVSFGRMTLPHGLVRVLVAEQLYRAFTIIAGHPYHRSGGGEA